LNFIETKFAEHAVNAKEKEKIRLHKNKIIVDEYFTILKAVKRF
jgi:hypothetical protein